MTPEGAARAPAKAAARRRQLLDRLLDHVLATGLSTASLRPLAAAVGTSDRMLLYYFGDKTTLIGEVLAHGAARLRLQLDGAIGPEPQAVVALARALHALVIAPDIWPYMKLWLEIAALAAQGDAVCRSVGEAIGRGFIDWIAVRLDVPDAERAKAAARVLRDVDAAALFHAVGLDDVVAAYAL